MSDRNSPYVLDGPEVKPETEVVQNRPSNSTSGSSLMAVIGRVIGQCVCVYVCVCVCVFHQSFNTR